MREAVRDQGAAPIVNLCPVGSAVNGGVTGVAWAPWPGTGGVATTSTISATWTPTGKATRIAWTTAPTTTAQGDTGVTFSGVLTPGQAYYAAITAVCSKATTLAVSVGNWTTTGGALGSGTGTWSGGTGAITVVAGQPTTFWVPFTPGANTTGCKVIVGASGTFTWAAGDTLDASCAVVLATASTAARLLPFGGYFDGSGVGPAQQAAWTGAANASNSVAWPLRADAVVNILPNSMCNNLSGTSVNWGTGGAGTLTAAASGGPSGGPYVQMAYSELPTDSTSVKQLGISSFTQTITGVIGNVYTFSAWVWVNASQSVNLKIDWLTTARVWVSSSSSTPVTVPANTWTRLTVTGTMPTGTGFLQPIVVLSTVPASATFTYRVAAAMVTQGSTVYPYADGSVPGWAWEGAAGFSPSHGPPYTVASLNTGQQRDDSVAAAVTLSPAVFDPVAEGVTIVTAADLTAIPPSGNTANLAYYGTASGDAANNSITHRFLGSASGPFMVQARRTAGGGPQANVSTTTGRYVVASGIKPGGQLWTAAPGSPVAYDPGGALSTVTNGYWSFWAADAYHSPVRGLLVAGYDEGNMWRLIGWLARQTGVTPPLEEIAGSPLARNTTANSTVTFAAPAATAGRTLYAAHNTTDSTQATAFAIAGTGGTVLGVATTGVQGSMIYRHNNASSVANRAQSNSTATITAPNTSVGGNGLHVGCAWMLEGDLGYGVMLDGNADTVVAQAASGGMPTGTNNLTLNAATASDAPLAAYIFAGTHDRITRLRIIAWLARRYGATPPAGY
jgi:hypothetical protein